MAGTPSDSDLDVGEPVEREGHETLLPSVQRSVLSTKSFVGDVESPSATGSVAPSGQPGEFDEVAQTEKLRVRGARAGDIVGERYIVEGQLGRGGMGRVLRVRHSALGKAFALKLIKSAIATTKSNAAHRGGNHLATCVGTPRGWWRRSQTPWITYPVASDPVEARRPTAAQQKTIAAIASSSRAVPAGGRCASIAPA